MNILKLLSNQTWGADEEILLRIYRSLIRSKLDYGSPNLKTLDTIQNTALRICLGAFCTTLVGSLYVESNEPPLHLRRQHLLASYLSRVSANPNNPLYPYLANHEASSSSLKTIFQIAAPSFSNIDLKQTTHILFSPTPPWLKRLPIVNNSLSGYKKQETIPALLRNAFSILATEGRFDSVLFSDASKLIVGVACAVTSQNSTVAQRKLPRFCCIHTAELYAIQTALEVIPRDSSRVAICSDSLSSINSIVDIYSLHPIAHYIQEKIHNLLGNNITITLVWVPSHVGIQGNELADSAAKDALKSTVPEIHVQLSGDLNNELKRISRSNWQQIWNSSRSGLRNILPSLKHLTLPALTRRERIIWRRLGLGHTRMTHGHLLSAEEAPRCSSCPNSLLTVSHVLSECTFFQDTSNQLKINKTTRELLSKESESRMIVQFLKETNLFYKI